MNYKKECLNLLAEKERIELQLLDIKSAIRALISERNEINLLRAQKECDKIETYFSSLE